MKLVIANLKMYLNSLEEVEKYQKEMENYKHDFIIAPQNIYLENFIRKGFTVSAQNSSDEEGSHTGEISPYSLSDLKVKYTLIGHAEIRKKYPEENNYINRKIEKAIKNNLKAILCIGEKNKKTTIEEIDKQLKEITPNEKLIISYEPVWAIGGVEIPEKEKLEEIVNHIKRKGHKKVLYGGSINENNIKNLININNIDGFLIGSSAYDTNKLKKIIEVVK